MADGFDLSDIPLTCDSQSDFDSTSELQGNSESFQSHTESRYPVQSLSVGDATDGGDRNIFCEDDWEGNSFGFDLQHSSADNSLIQAPNENDSSQEKVENYGGRYRTEEEMMLREFDLLDEVGPYDDHEKSNNFCDDESDDDCDDLLEEEIDAMLEENVEEPSKKKPRLENTPEAFKKSLSDNENKGEEEEYEDGDYIKKDKTVLVEKVKNHFEVLPDGWVVLTHNSGMPLYLHRASRVCTLSKPYSLGTGSARKHAIPLSAVPCLEYRRAKEDEEKKKNCDQENCVRIVNGTEIPSARIETAQENESNRQLTPDQLTEYCKTLFEFETIQVFKFKSWLARRKFKKKAEKAQERPTLPKDTKLITCMIKQTNGCGKPGNTREWIMNPNGKSYVCILHEYVQRVLKDQPVYTFKELENLTMLIYFVRGAKFIH